MALKDLFKKYESLISLDIGSHSVKLCEFDMAEEKPVLVNAAISPLGGEVFASQIISKPDRVAELISTMIESSGITDRRVVIALPGPSLFIKKIKVPRMSSTELANNIRFEASNSIPHNIDAVRLDYHVLGAGGKNQLEVLVVAVKNEIIDSFLDVISQSGLESAVVDADYFAMQNIFELAHPELSEKTVALINIGARYSSINICRGGQSLFTGDVTIGGKSFSDALVGGLGIQFAQAEELKRKPLSSESSDEYIAQGIIQKNIESASGEFNRQLSFFWSASGADEGIDKIMLAGGACRLPGLREALAERTGIACDFLNPFAGVETSGNVDSKYLQEISSSMCVAAGLALRQPGDKIIPELEES